MFLDIFKQFNWVDVLIIILFLRILYIAIKNGLPSEIFKLLGTILAIYLSLHYYTTVSDFLRTRLDLRVMPLEFLDFICFVLLALLGYGIFLFLREMFGRLIKIEAVPIFSRWGGLFLGVFRAFLLASLLIYAFIISYVEYIRVSTVQSFLGKRINNIAPATYSNIWNNFMSKFMTQEKFNQTVWEIQGEPKQ